MAETKTDTPPAAETMTTTGAATGGAKSHRKKIDRAQVLALMEATHANTRDVSPQVEPLAQAAHAALADLAAALGEK